MAFGTAKASVVTINGVNMANYLLEWTAKGTISQDFGTGTLKLIRSVLDDFPDDIANGKTVIIKRGGTDGTETVIFRGRIEKLDQEGEKAFISLECLDKMAELGRVEDVVSFDATLDSQAGEISAIWEYLVETSGGMKTSSTSVTASGTTLILDKFIVNRHKIYERMSALKTALGWQQYYNPTNDFFYFEPLGNTTYGTTLTVGSNIVNAPTWEYDTESMINTLIVEGLSQEVETNQLFSGDASTKNFTLTYVPVNVKVSVSSVEKVAGISGSTATYDYSVDDDPDVKQIQFITAPALGTNNISVDYTYKVPRNVEVQNDSSRDQYGPRESSVVYQDLRTVDDARMRGEEVLAKYSNRFAKVKLEITDASGIRAGNKVHIVDSVNNVDREMVALSIEYRWPTDVDLITCGDKEYKLQEWLVGMHERVAALEKQENRNQGILTHIRTLTRRDIPFKPRYIQLNKVDVTGNTAFILGHSTMGILGTNKLGSTYDVSTTTTRFRIIQGDQTYEELMYDTDFKDATNTTGTWDTANRRWDMTNKQVIQTNTVWFNNVSLSSITITADDRRKADIQFKINTSTHPIGRVGMDIYEE